MRAPNWALAATMAVGGLGGMMPQVSGTGMEKVDVLPSIVRMSVKIEAKADTLEKAVADVQAQYEQIKGKLAATNPTEGSVKMQGPELAGGGPEMQQRMAQMMRQRFGQPAQAAEPKKEAKKEVAVEATVLAEWKLTAADAAGLLSESEKMREAARAAMPEKPAAKPEAASEEEEENALRQQAGEQPGAKPGEPIFAFVSRVDKAQLAKARQEAFAKAKQNAQATAEAAGGKLGAPMSVTSRATPLNEEGRYGSMPFYAFQSMQGAMGGFGQSIEEGEVVTPVMKQTPFDVNVSATFALEDAK